MLRRPDGSVRYYTVHEAALLQDFPKDYIMCGSRTSAMRQIGNAAPPGVVRAFCAEIARQLHQAVRRDSTEPPHIDLVDDQPLTKL